MLKLIEFNSQLLLQPVHYTIVWYEYVIHGGTYKFNKNFECGWSWLYNAIYFPDCTIPFIFLTAQCHLLSWLYNAIYCTGSTMPFIVLPLQCHLLSWPYMPFIVLHLQCHLLYWLYNAIIVLIVQCHSLYWLYNDIYCTASTMPFIVLTV